MLIKKGAIVAITSGKYSDYCLDGHVIALKDFDPREQAGILKNSSATKTYLSRHAFLTYLISNGFVEPTNTVVELWMGPLYDGFVPDDIDIKEENAI